MTEKFFAPNKIVYLQNYRSAGKASLDNDATLKPDTLARCSEKAARELLEYRYAAKHRILPLGIVRTLRQELLTLACADPNDSELKRVIEFTTGHSAKLLAVPLEVLDQAIFFAYHGDDSILSEKASALKVASRTEKTIDSEFANAVRIYSDDSEPAGFLTTLLDFAISKGASDIHILPMFSGTQIRLRVSGTLLDHDSPVCSKMQHRQLINRIRVLIDSAATKPGLPQDGSFVLPCNGRLVNIRVSLMPTVHGDKAVLRILGRGSLMKKEDLGLSHSCTFHIDQYLCRQEGAAIFSGPTGSGKTTTLYALINSIKERGLNITSIEDPVEFEIEKVSQTALNPEIGLDYSTCLRSILRQDPDVIMLGEIRDGLSADAFFRAAVSGHLVMSTVHSPNVLGIFSRLKALSSDWDLMLQGLSLLVAQRLLPNLCSLCSVIDLNASNECGFEIKQSIGCSRCDYTGYSGRFLIGESLLLQPGLRKRLMQGLPERDEFLALCQKNHYSSWDDTLLDQLRRGALDHEHYRKFVNHEKSSFSS